MQVNWPTCVLQSSAPLVLPDLVPGTVIVPALSSTRRPTPAFHLVIISADHLLHLYHTSLSIWHSRCPDATSARMLTGCDARLRVAVFAARSAAAVTGRWVTVVVVRAEGFRVLRTLDEGYDWPSTVLQYEGKINITFLVFDCPAIRRTNKYNNSGLWLPCSRKD